MPDWIPFDDACHILAVPAAEVAQLLLAGRIPFTLAPDAHVRVATDDTVRTVDVLLDEDVVRDVREERWDDPAADIALADSRINRAALRWAKHPTRTGRGVRGPARSKGGADAPAE